MELFQLHYAVTLADCCNFSRAAEKLYITQPTLSQQIKKLEKECGFPLFLRNSKKVSLSKKGNLFIEKARVVLDDFQSLQDMVQEARGQCSRDIFLGISMAGRSYVAECTQKLILQFPNINFHLVETWGPELIDAVRSGRVDLAVADLDRPEDWSGLNVTPISNEYLCLVVNQEHPLAGRKMVSLQDLKHETLIFSSLKNSGISQLVIRAFEQEGLQPNLGMELNSTETCASFVSGGIGVTIATNVRAKWYERYQLSVIPIEPHICRIYALISSENSPGRQAVKTIRPLLERALREQGLKAKFEP